LENEDFSEFQFQERNNFNVPNRREEYIFQSIYNEVLPPARQFFEPSPSFLISSINSEYYQNLLEESQMNSHNYGNFNLSNEMSSFRTQNDQIRKLDRIISFESDKTPLQYLNRLGPHHGYTKSTASNGIIGGYHNINNFNNTPNVTLSHRPTNLGENKINSNKGDEEDIYNEGEENVDESDLDKTKEHIHVIDPK
jgi:hypothetical protein